MIKKILSGIFLLCALVVMHTNIAKAQEPTTATTLSQTELLKSLLAQLEVLKQKLAELKSTEAEKQIMIITPQDGDVFCLEQEPIKIQWTGLSDIESQKVSVGTDMSLRGGGLYVAELSGSRNATTKTSTYSFNWSGNSLYSKSEITGNTLQVGVSGYMKDGTQFNKIMEGNFERQPCD